VQHRQELSPAEVPGLFVWVFGQSEPRVVLGQDRASSTPAVPRVGSNLEVETAAGEGLGELDFPVEERLVGGDLGGTQEPGEFEIDLVRFAHTHPGGQPRSYSSSSLSEVKPLTRASAGMSVVPRTASANASQASRSARATRRREIVPAVDTVTVRVVRWGSARW